jgi:hypothetical protein
VSIPAPITTREARVTVDSPAGNARRRRNAHRPAATATTPPNSTRSYRGGSMQLRAARVDFHHDHERRQ